MKPFPPTFSGYEDLYNLPCKLKEFAPNTKLWFQKVARLQAYP